MEQKKTILGIGNKHLITWPYTQSIQLNNENNSRKYFANFGTTEQQVKHINFKDPNEIWQRGKFHTSMSSLYFSKGASMIFRREKVSDSISNVCPVKVAIRSQCLCFMALLAMSSRRGQLSLKSSIVFFKSKKACQSFKARGSLRQLEKESRTSPWVTE